MKDCPHLLLADDNPDEVFFIKRAILRACPESDLEVVSTGVQAIERLSALVEDNEQVTAPDAMILDLNMPVQGGFDVLRWLKDHHIACPVIIHTSSDDPNDVAKGKSLGAADYVVKEVGYRPLISKLTKILSN